MATVYIIFSKKINKYFIGSCMDFSERLEEHRLKKFKGTFTTRTDDWELFHAIHDLEYSQARRIELHIKNMRTREYYNNLKKFPELVEKLKERFK
jgi:putative endonuclease